MTEPRRDSSRSFDYARAFGAQYHDARKIPPQAEKWIARIRAEKFGPFIKGTDRLLEYGVGFGWNLASVQSAEKVGLDVTPELRECVEAKGIRFAQSAGELKHGHFDKVLCHHALEHIGTPARCLREIRDLLRLSGQMLLFVPFERERKYLSYRRDDKAHHLYSWSPASLGRLVQTAGFEIQSTKLLKFRFDRAAGIWATRLKGNFWLYRLLRNLGLLLLPEWEIQVVAQRAEL